MAVASLVCSIVGLVLLPTVVFPLLLSILAIIFGAVARKRNPHANTSSKLALAGLIIGIITVVITILMIALFGAAMVVYNMSY